MSPWNLGSHQTIDDISLEAITPTISDILDPSVSQNEYELIHQFNIHEFDNESNYESDAPKQVASNYNSQIDCKNINLQLPDNEGKNYGIC